MHGDQIQQIELSISTRTLGVHVTPTLNWKGKFEVMKRKLNVSIIKLMQTNKNPFHAATCCYTCMAKSVYFGCGIVKLSRKQEDELKRIHEEPLLMRLGLSRTFPRTVSCSRKVHLELES